MLHFGVLENTFGTEHGAVILTVELDFLGGMNIAVSDGAHHFIWIINVSLTCIIVNTHGQSGQYGVVDRQILRDSMVSYLVVWTFNHLMFVKLFDALVAERMSARE